MNFTLQPGESKIDTWTILYIPPDGGKYNGKLSITNQRLLYDALYDASFKGYVARTVIMRFGSEGYLEINKKDIQKVDVVKKLLSKRCTLTLSDGSQHAFDYGALNIDKVVAAIEAR